VEESDLAVQKFGEIRNKPANNAVRKFKVPSKNFKASSYTNLIDWNTDIFTQPPLTINMSVEELSKYVEGVEDHEIFKYPYHTQGCIRFVSKGQAAFVAQKKKTWHDIVQNFSRHFSY
jgi:hypothetical protein